MRAYQMCLGDEEKKMNEEWRLNMPPTRELKTVQKRWISEGESSISIFHKMCVCVCECERIFIPQLMVLVCRQRWKKTWYMRIWQVMWWWKKNKSNCWCVGENNEQQRKKMIKKKYSEFECFGIEFSVNVSHDNILATSLIHYIRSHLFVVCVNSTTNR